MQSFSEEKLKIYSKWNLSLKNFHSLIITSMEHRPKGPMEPSQSLASMLFSQGTLL